jgi:hypothetical protein
MLIYMIWLCFRSVSIIVTTDFFMCCYHPGQQMKKKFLQLILNFRNMFNWFCQQIERNQHLLTCTYVSIESDHVLARHLNRAIFKLYLDFMQGGRQTFLILKKTEPLTLRSTGIRQIYINVACFLKSDLFSLSNADNKYASLILSTVRIGQSASCIMRLYSKPNSL